MPKYYDGWEQNEAWAPLKKFPNYEISTYGRIRNERTGHILKPFPDRYGYLRVSIGNTDNVYIHRLMCETFLDKPRYENAQVNHIDCDRQNNHIFNLEWCTPSENIKWACEHGSLDYRKGLDKAIEVNRKRVRIRELDKKFNSVKECSEFLGVLPTRVSRCLVGERKGQRIHGYHVEFVEELEVG